MSRLIDADALIPDFLVTTPANNTPCKRYVSMEQIHDAPTIESEQRTGKWKETDDGWDGVYYVCSECGCPWALIDGTPYDNGMNYCPNCGCKMEGEE